MPPNDAHDDERSSDNQHLLTAYFLAITELQNFSEKRTVFAGTTFSMEKNFFPPSGKKLANPGCLLDTC